jgi:putative ABC transport system permease protein
MLGTLKSIGYRFQRNPLRVALILVTVAIGVAVLALSLSVSFEISALVRRVLPARGRLVSFTNASLRADGTLDRSGSQGITLDDISALGSEYPQLRDLTPIAPAMGWGTVQVGDTLWQPRAIQGVGSAFASLLQLHMAAGAFFTSADEEEHAQVVAISESVARALFGSPEAALGKSISSVAKMIVARAVIGSAEPKQQATVVQNPFTVVGVFRDVDDVTRRAFGVGDLLVPYTSFLPKDIPLPPMIMSVMARASVDAAPVARARVTDILQRIHGSDYPVALWEGNPDHPDTVIADSRDSLTRFSLFLSVLGLLVLVVSSFGIFSVMLVEVIDRNREIGLRRAMGSTRPGIVLHLAGQAAWLAALGALVGLAVAAVFRTSLVSALGPYLETAGVRPADLRSGIMELPAFLVAAGAAVAAGALFALFPAWLAARRPIVECIREQ